MAEPNDDNGNGSGNNNEYNASFWVPGTIALEDCMCPVYQLNSRLGVPFVKLTESQCNTRW